MVLAAVRGRATARGRAGVRPIASRAKTCRCTEGVTPSGTSRPGPGQRGHGPAEGRGPSRIRVGVGANAPPRASDVPHTAAKLRDGGSDHARSLSRRCRQVRRAWNSEDDELRASHDAPSSASPRSPLLARRSFTYDAPKARSGGARPMKPTSGAMAGAWGGARTRPDQAASNTSATLTVKPSRQSDSARRPLLNTPCSAYASPSRTSTVTVSSMGLTIQYSGMRAWA